MNRYKLLLLLALLPGALSAQTFTTGCSVSWTALAEPVGPGETIKGYRLYFNAIEVYEGTALTVDCSAFTGITLTTETTYNFSLVAYTDSGESDPQTVTTFIDSASQTISEGQPATATFMLTVPDAPNTPGVTP